METTKQIVETPVKDPIEKVLDIEEGTTLVPHTQRTTELSVSEEYDCKDSEIEGQLQEVYDTAMDAFDDQFGTADQVDGKYKARNGEVAVQFLNTALAAAREKSMLKQHKDKVGIAKGKLGTPKSMTQNNIVVADRNELLKRFFNQKEEDENS